MILIVSFIFAFHDVKAQQLTTRILTDDLAGDQMGQLWWYIPTWMSPTDGTFFGRTQVRTSQNSGLPRVINGLAKIIVDSYNPTGFSFYGTDAITKRAFVPGKGLIFTVRARMSTPYSKGVVGGIYLYGKSIANSTMHDEIDYELLTNNPRRAHNNLYYNEVLGTGHPDSSLFAGSTTIADWHVYTIEWLPNSVTWKVDGVVVRTSSSSPQGPMNFNLNMWVPAAEWSDAYSATIQPTSDPAANLTNTMDVDYVTVDSLVDVIPASNDAALKNLTTSVETLSPPFSPSTANYTVSVDNSVSSLAVTPTIRQTDAKATVNGIAVASGQSSSPIVLNVGDNTISTIVTAQNGTSTIMYTVVVTRAAPILSTDATLKSLTISSGTLNPAFDPTTSIYNVDIENIVSSLTFTPTVNQADATVTVNGIAVTSGQASPPFDISVGDSQIRFDVTAEDGITVRTYLIVIHRDIATGINDNVDTKYYFYPRPAHTNIFFSIQGKIKVSICSFYGKLLLEKVIDGGFLSVEGLLPGTYIIWYEQKDRNIYRAEKLIII